MGYYDEKNILALLLVTTVFLPPLTHAGELSSSRAADVGYGPVIIWPKSFTPSKTDNFVSNEVVISGLSIRDVWPFLVEALKWPSYYKNVGDVVFHEKGETELHYGTRFKFTTFNFPVESEVTEFKPSVNGGPARIAWHECVEGDAQHRLDVHHAWLLENLPDGRLRILTEESQIGMSAQELHNTLPNPMLNAHQLWLAALVEAAQHARN